MKKIFFLLFTLVLLAVQANAQMTRWVIRPEYGNLRIAQGAPLILGDSLGTTVMWDMDAVRLSATNDSLLPFVEERAVTIKKGTNVVTGFYTANGKFKRLDDCRIAHNMPYFSNGYLLLMGSYGYRLVDGNGKDASLGYFEEIYPFNNGYATCMTYENVEKKKNPYYLYITTDNRKINFKYGKKEFDAEDVQFLSSIGDDGMGVAVIDDKVYHFNSETLELTPVLPRKDEVNPKRQVEVIMNGDGFIYDMQDSLIIRCKNSKKEYVRFHFDRHLMLTKTVYADREEVVGQEEPETVTYPSALNGVKAENGNWGLECGGEEVLPAQFGGVAFCLKDYAAVCHKGKWGMLYHDKSLKYRLIMNGGNKIPFRHKLYSSTVKLELPSIITADKCRFNIPEEFGCIIDKISIETKNTENGNFVKYNCTLTIPDSLPDVVTDIQYPVDIVYDGIVYPTVPLKTKAWHYKYINVNLDDTETTISQGDVSFTINITADKQQGDSDYPFEIGVQTDSLRTELVKISETRYKCNMYALAEGVNMVNISIHEEGCPPSVFPFEITYVKPKEKTKDTPEVKEGVRIEKKAYVPPVKKEEEKEEEGEEEEEMVIPV